MGWIIGIGIAVLLVLWAPFAMQMGFGLYLVAAMNGWINPMPPIDIAGERAGSLMAKCIQPIVSDCDRLVVAEVNEGDTLADVTVGETDDNHTVVRVHVGWSYAPITAVLVGRGVIWDFDGAVDRIDRVYAITSYQDAPSAVRGIAAEKASFPILSLGCHFGHLDARQTNGRSLQDVGLTVMFGRAPNSTAYTYEAERLDLPTGRLSERGSVVAGGTAYYPGGVLDLAPATLVADAPIRDRPPELVRTAFDGKPIPVKREVLVLPPWPTR